MIKIERIETRTKDVKVKEFKDLSEAMCYIQNKSGYTNGQIKAQLDKSNQLITRDCIFRVIK